MHYIVAIFNLTAKVKKGEKITKGNQTHKSTEKQTRLWQKITKRHSTIYNNLHITTLKQNSQEAEYQQNRN